ncbi:WD40 repeat domain-containing protein [Saccharothrix saharensis]|uniref:WD40 repeat domain-containing protein n=1 Tax=Saccharothrix saharensis TaxID=571190 RepID=UPI003689E994
MIDLDRGEVVGELDGFGDWSVEPRFAPDGRTLAVGNSMQGTWWLTVLELGDDGNPQRRYDREDGLPTGNGSEIVTDVAFTPDGHRFATWVRPDYGCQGPNGYRGLVATTWTQSGEAAWHLHVDDDVIGAPGQAVSASLCFTPDGSWLAVGLDPGVLWLDAETGRPAGHDRTAGTVNFLAAHPDLGLLAATEHGLRLLDLPPG